MSYTPVPVPSETNQQTIDPSTAPSYSDPPPEYSSILAEKQRSTQQQPVVQYVMQPQVTQQPPFTVCLIIINHQTSIIRVYPRMYLILIKNFPLPLTDPNSILVHK